MYTYDNQHNAIKNWPKVVVAIDVEKLPKDARRKQSRFDTWVYDINLCKTLLQLK